MSRIDTPEWKCDRCGYTTKNEGEITPIGIPPGTGGRGGINQDLCSTCFAGFATFLTNEQAVDVVTIGGPIAVTEPIEVVAEPVEGVPETVEEV